MLCPKCHSDYLRPPTAPGRLFAASCVRCQVCHTDYRFSNKLKVAIPLLTLLAELLGINIASVSATAGVPAGLAGFALVVICLVYAVSRAIQRPLVAVDGGNYTNLSNCMAVATLLTSFIYLLV